ncbi:SAM dependent methyltransferase, putative [Ichthyophthirius multifiliis]|uniref:protein-histidine N-methyltransferase n=1 Tax=Ichthyophthirius multifiliis TaxID=5932 RepID=G0R4L3_ICHMU|nr:SAM dependent methyltransferase, putative [Ichthyophthirius multifiliis]EGR27573.1 SAM dependent methyltransferase, putative [Ichthyophthirius multifiliis]|eukprot:XP_004025025.1 SAM dependent methyltransferase, putative [Ichthyophthirius multifiliis]
MDLGCGHGLLGIYALLKNAAYVLFQDFNYEVLSIAVRMNLDLNKVQKLDERVIYLSGEWNDLDKKIDQQLNEIQFIEKNIKLNSYQKQFDMLLMSEVIYNVENYEKVINLVLKFMKKDGVSILANKLYYFGVGGSMPEFKQFVLKYYLNIIFFIISTVVIFQVFFY